METFITDSIKIESLRILKKLINIPSYNTQQNGLLAFPPFGKNIDLALKETLAVCDKLGMDTFYDPEGFYGFAEYGDGEETVGVLCHLDVVPGGNPDDWDSDPFKATERNNVLYGRGAQDDKGPTVAALYAFKAVIDKYENFNRKIRFVFGTDEETLWRCMNVYKKHEELPDLGFVPDATFPLTYAEKGLLQARLIGPGAAKLNMKCGGAPNVVPDRVEYVGVDVENLAKTLDQLNIEYSMEGDKLTVHGKSVHASAAFDGINAISLLAKGLVSFQPHPAISFIAEKIGQETNGYSLFGEVKDDVTGELTLNVASLVISDEGSEIVLDLRIPINYDAENLVPALEKAAALYGLEYEQVDALPSLYVPEDSELVETLMSVYQDKTGDMSKPHTSGGATYARSMPNMVAFGAHFPKTQSLAHQVNEGIILDEFYQAMDIYAEAIYRLCVEIENE